MRQSNLYNGNPYTGKITFYIAMTPMALRFVLIWSVNECRQQVRDAKGNKLQQLGHVTDNSWSSNTRLGQWTGHDIPNKHGMMTSSNGNIFRVTGSLCGIHQSPVLYPHKDQWCGALMFSLIYAWINSSVNNLEAGYLRCHHTHYDITVMDTARHIISLG